MNNDEFLKEIKKYGGIKPVKEAFKDYPVEEEEHKGRLDDYVSEEKAKYNNCYDIGDIITIKN